MLNGNQLPFDTYFKSIEPIQNALPDLKSVIR